MPWDPWTLTGLTDGASVLLNWLHPAIPLDPPPGWLVSLVYGLAPLAAVFAWHLFLEHLTSVTTRTTSRLARTAPSSPTPSRDQAQDPGVAEPREVVHTLLGGETPQDPVTGPQVQATTGLSRSRVYAGCGSCVPRRPAVTAPRPPSAAATLAATPVPAPREPATCQAPAARRGLSRCGAKPTELVSGPG